MSIVHLEILSPLAETLGVNFESNTIILERQIEDGNVVRDILNRLGTEYPRFAEVVFDVKAQKQTERVNIFLNGRNLELVNGLETSLSDGDTLTFFPSIIGG